MSSAEGFDQVVLVVVINRAPRNSSYAVVPRFPTQDGDIMLIGSYQSVDDFPCNFWSAKSVWVLP